MKELVMTMVLTRREIKQFTENLRSDGVSSVNVYFEFETRGNQCLDRYVRYVPIKDGSEVRGSSTRLFYGTVDKAEIWQRYAPSFYLPIIPAIMEMRHYLDVRTSDLSHLESLGLEVCVFRETEDGFELVTPKHEEEARKLVENFPDFHI